MRRLSQALDIKKAASEATSVRLVQVANLAT